MSVLGFGWNGVSPFKEEVFDIKFYGQTTCAVGVVPGEVDAGELGAGPVLGEFIVIRRGLGATCGAIGRG